MPRRMRVFNAAVIDYATPSGPTRTGSTPTSFFASSYQVDESRLMYRRLLAAGVSTPKPSWFLGDFKRAFAYMENWPITVTQAAAEQRGRIQPGHRRALQGQRARRGGGAQSALRRHEHCDLQWTARTGEHHARLIAVRRAPTPGQRRSARSPPRRAAAAAEPPVPVIYRNRTVNDL